MSRFNHSPQLHITETLINKLSLKDHTDDVLENVYNFYLNNGKKRNHYQYETYHDSGELIVELKKLLRLVIVRPMNCDTLFLS